MTMQHPPVAVLLAFALLGGACGDDDKPSPEKSTRDSAVEEDRDRDAGKGGSSGGSAKDAGRDATTTRDARVEPARDAAGGEQPDDRNDAGGTSEPTACDPSAAPTIPPLALETVVSGLSGLTFAAQPPGASEWYLLQQSGQIRVFKDNALLPAPFLDLSAQVRLTSSPIVDDERGLLGLAFPPDYATSGKFYVMLTPTTGDGAGQDTVREYKRSAANPLVADAMPTRTMVQLPASAVNHNGGNIAVGPDGMLYVGTGDGGGRCNDDQRGAPQDTNSLFGKILRLDPNAAAAPYAAAGNPFTGEAASVWHYGLRNPYRFSFDRETGDLYIGDVGQDAFEELDFAKSGDKGLNFGWPAYEGNVKSSGSMGTCATSAVRSGSTATPPIAEFDRRMSATGDFRDYRSVIGGEVYRGAALPALKGVYLFGDYVGIRMGALRQCGATTSKITTIAKNRDANAPDAPSFSRTSGDPALGDLTAIVSDNAGELYFVANFDRLYKVVPRK